MQQISNQSRNGFEYERRIKKEVDGIGFNEIKMWINSIHDVFDFKNSYNRFKNQNTIDDNKLYSIRPLDFLSSVINQEDYEENISKWRDVVGWQHVPGDGYLWESITWAAWESLEKEFFAYLNSAFTAKLTLADFVEEPLEAEIMFEIPKMFNINFFDITKPTQAYDIMKPFIEESYRVSKKPLVSWSGYSLSILGAGFNQLNELDHFKVFHNGNEIYKNIFVKKDVAIGFNRNPFTPNEYKYVTQSIDNHFDLGAPLANSLQLNKTNTELKFYDASDKEINLDFEDAN